MENKIMKILWKWSVDGKIDQYSYEDMAAELAKMVSKNLHKPLVMLSLPSDEEADAAAIRFGTLEDSNGKKVEDSNMVYGFIECFNWMRDEIRKRGNGAYGAGLNAVAPKLQHKLY